MARIGVFIDALGGSLSSSFQERIASFVQELPQVVFCHREVDLTSSQGVSRMAIRLKEGEADRLLIIGGSPKLYESSFQKWARPLPINPYLLTVANVREQVLWITKDEARTLEKAKGIITKALRQALASQPIESQSFPLKPDVLVLGGGIIGISIALTLAKAGVHVCLLEKGSELGGRVRELRAFYNRPQEVRKWVDEKVSELSKTSNITLLTQTELKYLKGHLGNFQAKVVTRDGKQDILHISTIVVATGYETLRETRGIYSHKRVITLSGMERLLSEAKGPSLRYEGKDVGTVTYLLDTANEDSKIDSINAIKQSLKLQASFQCQVAILCKDVKVSADGMERLYRRAREKGVLFIKYDQAPKLSIVNGQIQIDVKDTTSIQKNDQWPVSILSDLLIVSEAYVPTSETESLSRLLKIHLGSRGFLMEDNPQFLRVRSNRRGIFVAGGCRFPQEVSESLTEAGAVAEEVLALLLRGEYTCDLAVAEVDPKKCAICYTCPRLCPHAAITIEHYAEKNIYTVSGREEKWAAAKVDPAACFGCGICVAECPAKAITLRHLTDEQIYAQMGLME